MSAALPPIHRRPDEGAEFPSPRAAIEAFVNDGWHEQVRARLAARYQRMSGSAAVDEAVGHALERAVERLHTRSGRQVYSFVLTAAERRLLDGVRQDKRARAHGWLGSTDTEAVAATADRTEDGVEQAWAERDARALVQEASAVLVDMLEQENGLSLTARTLEVLRLFHLEGLTKREIRTRTGLTEKQLRTSLASGNRVLHDQFLTIEADLTRDCGSSRRAVLRLAFDLAKGREAARARAHLGHCLSCERQLRYAQAFRRNVAAMFPLPIAHTAHADGGLFTRVAEFGRDVCQRALAKATAAPLASNAVVGACVAAGFSLPGNQPIRADMAGPSETGSISAQTAERSPSNRGLLLEKRSGARGNGAPPRPASRRTREAETSRVTTAASRTPRPTKRGVPEESPVPGTAPSGAQPDTRTTTPRPAADPVRPGAEFPSF